MTPSNQFTYFLWSGNKLLHNRHMNNREIGNEQIVSNYHHLPNPKIRKTPKMIQFNRKIVVLILIFCFSASIYFSNLSLVNELKLRLEQRRRSSSIVFTNLNHRVCTLKTTCFDLNRCQQSNGRLKIYIYPHPRQIVNKIFAQIIEFLNSSTYVTSDPTEACLFLAPLDTLDRDKLSSRFVRDLDKSLKQLSYWNESGRNHLIFNLYSGSWPDYVESQIEINQELVKHAILVKASFSSNVYRPGFDVSFPLFHSDVPYNNSNTSSASSTTTTNAFQSSYKKYFLTFKVLI